MKYFPKNALECKKIVTVSEFSKKDIVDKMEVPTGKVHVVYNAANPLYEPKSEQDNQKTKDKYTQGKDFFYFVGAIHKRKTLWEYLRRLICSRKQLIVMLNWL